MCIEEYVDLLTKDENIHVPKSKENINVCISGGGMANMYVVGCGSFLTYMTVNKNLKIHNIYGTSAGSVAGLLLLLALHSLKNEKYNNTKYEMNGSKFIYLINNKLYEKYMNNPYIADILIEFLEEIIPPDFYIVCCNKLFITINVIDNFSIHKKVISKYKSNKHLLNTIHCSASIPFITTKKIISKYFDPFTQTKYWAFDGIYPSIENLSYPTLYFDTFAVNYSYLNCMKIVDKCYQSLVFDGLYDIYHTYRKDLFDLNSYNNLGDRLKEQKIQKMQKNTHKIIYYYNPININKYKVFQKIIIYGIIIGTIYYYSLWNSFTVLMHNISYLY